MSISMPETVTYGKVVGRFIQCVDDSLDSDDLPDVIAVIGKITFMPTIRMFKEIEELQATTIARPVTTVSIGDDGFLTSPSGDVGVKLITGGYKVSYELQGVTIRSHDIVVLPEHNDDTPLDLTLAIPPEGLAISQSEFAEIVARLSNIENSPLIRDAAAAVESAESAAESAASAALSAGLVGAPADAAVAAIVGNPASATRVSLGSTYAGAGKIPTGVFDGVTNDAAALASAMSTARIVELSGRTMASGLVVASTSKVTVRNGKINLVGAVGPYSATFYHENLTDLTYENVTFTQDAAFPTIAGSPPRRALAFTTCQRVRLINCTFVGMTSEAVRFTACSEVVVQNCTFTDNNKISITTLDASDDYGDLAINTTNGALVTGCLFTNGGTGISLYAGVNATVRSNRLIGNPVNVSAMGLYVLDDSRHVTIEDNYIEGFKNEGVILGNGIGSTKMVRWGVVRGNRIVNCAYAGVSIGPYASEVTVSDNFIEGAVGSAAHLVMVTDAPQVRIIGNTLAGECYNGVNLSGSSHIEVSGNQITATPNGGAQINVNQTYRTVVANNELTVPAAKFGLLIYPYSGGCVLSVVGNLIAGVDATAKLLYWTGSGQLNLSTISGNRLMTGIVSLIHNQNSTFFGNMFSGVTTTVTNDGGCVIRGNYGLADSP